MSTAAAELMTILHDEGVSHLFVNPVMQTAALRAALAEADASGALHPQVVLCVHEHVALCAAAGHSLAAGTPEAVMVHVERGPLNLAALDNAIRDRIPAVVFSDEGHADPGDATPSTRTRARRPRPEAPGKWTGELSRSTALGPVVRRGFQIARAEPTGVTHVTLPRELLGQPGGRPSRRLPPPRPPAPDEGALDQMAELLAAAESPLIVAGSVGRHQASVQQLAMLAETLGAPVVDLRNRVNLPLDHPLNAAMESRDLLASADAVLLLDVGAICPPVSQHAWILQIDADCLKADLPGWAIPVEIAVTADTRLALPSLLTLLNYRIVASSQRVAERRARVEASLQEARQAWRTRATSPRREDLADAVLAELNLALPADTVVLEELASDGRALRQLERPPGQFFRSTSTRTGWSIGAAMGARLARPGQPVVAVCDETAFHDGLPAAAFWSAHRAGAPFLVVVLESVERRPGRQSSSRRSPDEPALGPESDVVAFARSCGADATAVSSPSEVAGAVEGLLATTRDGVCAVLDARLLTP